MLPILDQNNVGTTWAARIAKLQQRLALSNQAREMPDRIQQMFVDSERALSEKAPPRENLLESLNSLDQRANAKDSFLTPEIIFDLQDALQIEKGLRVAPMAGQVPGHNPARPDALPGLLERTLDWFTAESFIELHPIEQAALAHVRFLDLQLFPGENTRLSRFVADFYLIKGDLPPLIIVDATNRYKAALHQALSMNTQSLIDLLIESTEGTLKKLL